MIAILVWEHWTRVYNLEPTAQQRQRVAIICLISLGLISISYSRSKLHWETGQKAAVNELPVVGADLEQWRTDGVLTYASSESKLTHGLMLAFSGRSDEKSIQQVAEKHHLQRIENPNASKKFLPLAKTWKLNKSGFQTDFKPDDLYYIGRMKDRNKAVLQIVFSKAEKRFTAEVFGSTLKQVAE